MKSSRLLRMDIAPSEHRADMETASTPFAGSF